MNANSQQPTPILVKDWLDDAASKLSGCGVPSACLDAELILAHELGKSRTFLHAHNDDLIGGKALAAANKSLELRQSRVPIAYIYGKKEFYGREFDVSDATLIPRPESEEAIESLKKLFNSGQLKLSENLRLVDVGTGCGVLGITAKLEFPQLTVTLSDISSDALRIATKNVNKYAPDVQVIESDLLGDYPGHPDIILANLPYVDPNWDRSAETNHEPPLALFARKNGQGIIERLLTQAEVRLQTKGFIVIEADPCQHTSLCEFANKLSLRNVDQSGYIITFQRI